jgi:hypothetical protein
MPHQPLTERDMALITVLCQDRETRCEQRLVAAVKDGDKVREKMAIRDYERYQSLRLKMFSPA